MANFSDLLRKIANNEKLTPQELDELGRFGTEIQNNNAKVSGVITSSNSINVNSVTTKELITDYVYSIGCRIVTNTTQVIPSGTPTAIQYHAKKYDDDSMFNPSVPEKININTSGRWLITCDMAWNALTTDGKYLSIAVYSSSDVLLGNISIDYRTASVTNSCTCMPFLEKGQYLKFFGSHGTAPNKTVNYSRIAMMLTRFSDSGDEYV